MEEIKQDSVEIQKLIDLVTSAHHCVAFTGAGISTLSGIQDFRGKNGLYRTMNADNMFDINRFKQDPSEYYRLAKDFIYGLDDKQPSIVHRVLALLEDKGYVDAIITQNVDLLHQKAGSKRVIEIHGTPAIHRCMNCPFTMSFSEAAKIVRKGEIPICPECGGAIKPDITFFGEMLPRVALEAADQHARKADLMLILGTSLIVHPAASLPEKTLRRGGTLVIVNDMPTPLDDYAVLKFPDLQSTFESLEKVIP